MLRTSRCFLLIVALLLTGARLSLAAAVSVTPSGNGVFLINGSGMDTVAGIDLTVSYDTALLASPAVTQGSLISGALMAVNTNKPGSIKIAAVSTRPFPASGLIATLSFATHSGGGRISVASSMINIKGSPVPGGGTAVAVDSPAAPGGSPGLITTAGIPFSQPAPTAPAPANVTTGTTASSPASTAAGGPSVAGTISLPVDVPVKSDPKQPETAATPPPVADTAVIMPAELPVAAAPVPKPQKIEPLRVTTLKGTLENFSTFKGEKTPANLVALLSRQNSAAIRQEPAFALSDGTTTVKITAELKNIGEKSPNFALQGAKMVSLTADSTASTWTITALPQAGVDQASLTILTDREIIELPLNLAPPVASVTHVDADFSAFLKDSGAVPPKRDLNSDGRYDYLDDFIYTVNYLSKKSIAGNPGK